MQTLVFRYDGLDADEHFIDAGKLGASLVGISKITRYGMFALVEKRYPKRGEQFPLSIKAGEPKEGSVDIITAFSAASWTLPVFPTMFEELLRDLVKEWISWVLSMTGGRESEAKQCFDRLAELVEKMQDDQLRSKQMDQQFVLDVLEKLRPAAKDVVAPIGPSCDSLTIVGDKSAKSIEVDTAMADAIRSKEKLEVSDMEELRIQVDGFTIHNRQLKIQDPDDPSRFVSAIVRDPAFDQVPNIYTEAAISTEPLLVRAKRTSKDGRLVRLYIMDSIAA